MKRIVYLAFLVGFLFILNSCITEPGFRPLETWLCSIKADGTEFCMIQKEPYNPSGIQEMYPTVDGKLLIYSDALWLYDPQDLSLVKITPDTLMSDQFCRVSQLPDGSKMYFSANRNLFELTYPSLQLRQLTTNSTLSHLINPVISKSGNILCFSSYTQMKDSKDYSNHAAYVNMETMEITYLPLLGQYIGNLVYNESNQCLYYTVSGQLKKCKLDGSDSAMVSLGCDVIHRFYLTEDQRYLLCGPGELRIINLLSSEVEVIETGEDSMGIGLFSSSNSGYSIFYASKWLNKIWKYNISNNANEMVIGIPSGIDIYAIRRMATTWDGSKLYFYCELTRG